MNRLKSIELIHEGSEHNFMLKILTVAWKIDDSLVRIEFIYMYMVNIIALINSYWIKKKHTVRNYGFLIRMSDKVIKVIL